MSAVAGIIRYDGAPVDRSELDRMRRSLAVHGSDSQSAQISDNSGLVHCLFATTTRDAFERQPLVHEAFTVVYCGRIDNRPDLFAELDIKPNPNMPDSALVARAHDRWGDDFARHLIGNFACAIYQPQRRRLILATDHVGYRPLYYHWDGRRFSFATAIKGLFALDGVPRELNEDAYVDILLRNDLDMGVTIYRSIQSVPPGHVLIVDEAGPVAARYWNAHDICELRLRDHREYNEAFRTLFDGVVAQHCDAAHPMGIMLSGGLDSQAIAASAATELAGRNAKLHGFTLTPDPAALRPTPHRNSYESERAKVEALAKRYPNIVPAFLRAEAHEDLGFLDREFFKHDGPVIATPTYMAGYHAIYAEASQRNVRVILNGTVGNHTISYDGRGLLFDLARSGRFLELLRQARKIASERDGSLANVLKSGLVQHLLPWRWRSIARNRPNEQLWSAFSMLASRGASDEDIGAYTDAAILSRMRARNNNKLFSQSLNERERRIARTCERNPGFGTGQMQGRFEFRVPAADRRILEFCLALPSEAFNYDGIDRRLIRVGMADRLPTDVCADRKRGLQNVDWIPRAQKLLPAYSRVLASAPKEAPLYRLVDHARLAAAVAGFDPQDLAQSRSGWMTELQGVQATIGHLRFMNWFDGRNDLGPNE